MLWHYITTDNDSSYNSFPRVFLNSKLISTFVGYVETEYMSPRISRYFQ